MNPAGTCRFHYLGRERRPVIVIDDFLPDAERLLDYAETGDPFRPLPNDYYPGVRKNCPPQYTEDLRTRYVRLFRETFGFGAMEPQVLLSALSIATTEPEQLRPVQRVPHFDTSDPQQLAVVHFLCEASHGGTSFYRHRATGYETISQDRLHGYAGMLKRQVMTEYLPPPKYMDGDNPLFETLASFDAKFNRALIYPSNVLHSGNVRHPHAGRSPRTARLTVNTFLKFPE